MKNSAVLSCIAVGILMLGGCAAKKPPLEDISNAKIALLKAKDADAKRLSPKTFALAQEQFQQSKISMDNKAYEEARQAAQKAYITAKLAEKKAQNAKAQMEVDKLSSEVKTLQKEFMTIKE